MSVENRAEHSLVLRRCRMDDAGHRFGLTAGDILLAVNGVAWRGSAVSLHKALAQHGRPSLLSFQRGSAAFSILTERADLGLWEQAAPNDGPVTIPTAGTPMQNWEIMADMRGNHDIFPIETSLLALIAPPLWLAKSRHWAGLALFGAVIALSLPVGVFLLVVVWVVAGLHLWRDGAAHHRTMLRMQGYSIRGILAARSESEAVATWCNLFPQARFRFAQTEPATGLQSELS